MKFLSKQLSEIYGDKIGMIPKGNHHIIRCCHSKTVDKILNDIYPVFPPINRKLDQIIKSPHISIPELKEEKISIDEINFYDRLNDGRPLCIFCQGNKITKAAYRNNQQEYHCNNCKKNFKRLEDYKILKLPIKDIINKLPTTIL